MLLATKDLDRLRPKLLKLVPCADKKYLASLKRQEKLTSMLDIEDQNLSLGDKNHSYAGETKIVVSGCKLLQRISDVVAIT